MKVTPYHFSNSMVNKSRVKSTKPVPVLFQGANSALNAALKSIDPNLKVVKASASNKAQIHELLRDFYLGEVDPASAQEKGYENQGSKILNFHEAILGTNIQKVKTGGPNVFHVVMNTQTGKTAATAALLKSALNGEHIPPSDAGQVSYFYKAKNVPDTVSFALIEDISQKAKALGLSSLYTSARRKGMADRNRLMKAAGFVEVTDPKRIEQLMPPALRGERNIVYEKLLH